MYKTLYTMGIPHYNIMAFLQYCCQCTGDNACENNLCEHFCLLSAVGSDGQSCMCQTGYILNEDQMSCDGM